MRRWRVLVGTLGGLSLLAVPEAWAADEGFPPGVRFIAGGGLVRSVAEETSVGGSIHVGVFGRLSGGLGGLVLVEVAPFSSHAGGPLGEGTFRLQMMAAGLAFRPLRGAWSPVVMAGGLVQASAFAIRHREAFTEVGVDIQTSNPQVTAGAWGGLGLDYRVSDRMSLWLWGRKAVLRTKLTLRVTDLVTGRSFEATTDPISLDPWWVQGSLVFRF